MFNITKPSARKEIYFQRLFEEKRNFVDVVTQIYPKATAKLHFIHHPSDL